jgi:hypothetical protein
MEPENSTTRESRALKVNVPWAVGKLGSPGHDRSRVPVPVFIRHGLGGKVLTTEKANVASSGLGGNPTQPAEQVPAPV